MQPHFELAVDVEKGRSVVRLSRTTAPFDTIPQMEAQYALVFAALDRIGRRGMRLLIDLRRAPGRNDPAFDLAMKRVRPKLFAGFVRVAVLVQSTVGALHVTRHAREDGLEALVSTDEARLFEYLFGAS
ncbi:MAG: hypothetical protein U1A78_13860 [Polyangia bacterium]